MAERKLSRQIIGKVVVSKSGKRFGEVANLHFEARNGEILQIALKNATGYAEAMNLERSPGNEILIPYGSVIASGDFIVVAEEDFL